MKKLLLFVLLCLLPALCFADYLVEYEWTETKKMGWKCDCPPMEEVNLTINCCWNDYWTITNASLKIFSTLEEVRNFSKNYKITNIYILGEKISSMGGLFLEDKNTILPTGEIGDN